MSHLVAGRIARGGELEAGWLEIEGDRIVASGSGPPPGGAEGDEGTIVAPGLVDLQVNGAAGVEVTDGAAALDAIDRVQLAHGVTSYLPTLVSPDVEAALGTLEEIAQRVDDPASPVDGVHVEGPYLSPDHAGMHPRERLRPVPAEPPALLRSGSVRIVTVAPELDGALHLIRALRERGVIVSLGHSAATAEQALAAVDAGACMATHAFNAMAPLGHRHPGLVGAALADRRVFVSVIADGVHVDATVLELTRRMAAGRLALVSDSTPGAAAPPGRYRMAGVDIERSQDGVARTSDGRLAGSSVTLDEAVRRWAGFTDATLAEAIYAAAEVPRRVLGEARPLEPGGFADLVVFDDAGVVLRVMRRGRWT